jgi:hypothetical protein
MDSALDRRALIRTSTAVDVIRGGEKGVPQNSDCLLFFENN